MLKVVVTLEEGSDMVSVEDIRRYFLEFCGEGSVGHEVGPNQTFVAELIECTEVVDA